jgi:hypothetical protein
LAEQARVNGENCHFKVILAEARCKYNQFENPQTAMIWRKVWRGVKKKRYPKEFFLSGTASHVREITFQYGKPFQHIDGAA